MDALAEEFGGWRGGGLEDEDGLYNCVDAEGLEERMG